MAGINNKEIVLIYIAEFACEVFEFEGYVLNRILAAFSM